MIFKCPICHSNMEPSWDIVTKSEYVTEEGKTRFAKCIRESCGAYAMLPYVLDQKDAPSFYEPILRIP